MNSASANYPLQGRKILIVEDDLLVAMSLETFLSAEGCSVLGPVSRVDKALRLLEREEPDAVILDLNLRGESSTAIAETLQKRGIPFVVLSGYTDQRLEAGAFQLARRLDKPVNPKALVDTLAEIVAPV